MICHSLGFYSKRDAPLWYFKVLQALVRLLIIDVAAAVANRNRFRCAHRSPHLYNVILLSPRSSHGIEEQVHCRGGFWNSADVSRSTESYSNSDTIRGY